MGTIEVGEERLSQPCVDRAVWDLLGGEFGVTRTGCRTGWLSSSRVQKARRTNKQTRPGWKGGG